VAEPKNFLSPADVSPALGVTTARVSQLIAAGEIPATRVGGSIRIPRDAWDEWLSKHRAAALAAIRPRRDGDAH